MYRTNDSEEAPAMKVEKSGLTVRSQQPEIGRLLIEAGILSEAQAQEAADYQRRHQVPFGRACVLMKYASEADVRFMLARQFHYAYLRQARPGHGVSEELVTAYEPFGEITAQFKRIRSQLVLQWLNEQHQSRQIALVSADRSEGRTYMAANLAVIFSQMGKSTLLVDGDMLFPRMHRLFDMPGNRGLSSILAGRARQADCVLAVPDLPGLFLLPAGPTPPNSLELLGDSGCSEVLANARQHFDVVIVDTPAHSAGDDCIMLGVHTGSALLVAQARQTRAAGIARLSDELRQAGVKTVGAALSHAGR